MCFFVLIRILPNPQDVILNLTGEIKYKSLAVIFAGADRSDPLAAAENFASVDDSNERDWAPPHGCLHYLRKRLWAGILHVLYTDRDIV